MPAVLSILVIAVDQLVKMYVETTMHLGQSIPVIQDIFHITYALNPGAAFGILANQRILFVLIGAALLCGAAYFYGWLKRQDLLTRIGAGLLLGGAVGNLIDRVQSGLVVDFLDFRVWPVFNVADIAITVGAGLLIISVIRSEEA